MSATKIIFATVVVAILCLVWFFSARLTDPEAPPAPTGSNTINVFPDSTPRVSYESQAGQEKIQAAFYGFLSEPTAINTWTTFSEKGQIVPLRAALAALSAKIEPSIERLLDQGKWQFYQCAGATEGQRHVVISLRFSLQQNYVGDLYADQQRGFRLWEQTLFRDMATILYPEEYFRITPTQTAEFVTDMKYPYAQVRIAPVRFSDGSAGQLSYVFVGDELLLGSNTECVIKAQELLFDTSA